MPGNPGPFGGEDSHFSLLLLPPGFAILIGPLDLTAQLLPNSAMLSFAIPTAPADMRIDVTNILGVKIEELAEKTSETGRQYFPLDLTHFIAGTYFVTLSACGLTQTAPLSVVK